MGSLVWGVPLRKWQHLFIDRPWDRACQHSPASLALHGGEAQPVPQTPGRWFPGPHPSPICEPGGRHNGGDAWPGGPLQPTGPEPTQCGGAGQCRAPGWAVPGWWAGAAPGPGACGGQAGGGPVSVGLASFLIRWDQPPLPHSQCALFSCAQAHFLRSESQAPHTKGQLLSPHPLTPAGTRGGLQFLPQGSR